MNIKEYFSESKFKIIMTNNFLNIVNYQELILLSETKIIIKANNMLTINGENLSILKLLDNEILIGGSFHNIEFR